MQHPLLTAHDLARHRQQSLLHREITDYIATLPLRWKLLLALRFHAELPMEDIAKLVGGHPGTAGNLITTAVGKIHEYAQAAVVDHPSPVLAVRTNPWPIPDAVHRWVWLNTRNPDVHTYLGCVQRDYAADVSYLVDMLNRSHGNLGPRPGLRVEREKQCGTRRGRARHLAAGEPVCEPCNAAHEAHKAWIREWHAKRRRAA